MPPRRCNYTPGGYRQFSGYQNYKFSMGIVTSVIPVRDRLFLFSALAIVLLTLLVRLEQSSV